MSEERIVFEEAIPGRSEVLRAAISPYQGKEFMHLRVWFYPEGMNRSPENLRPGKGLGMLTSQFGMVDRAVAALRKALAGGSGGDPSGPEVDPDDPDFVAF
jgi:hypothetical protein